MNNNQNINENLNPSEIKTTSGSRESRSDINKMNELEANLRQFCGTENYYRHTLSRMLYTDGVQYLAEKTGAYWLIDAVASYQNSNLKEKYPFQIWELKVNSDKSCIITMIEDISCPEIVHQEIEYTDFPLDYMKLYCIDNVLLLPSEY
ncbi:MAG: DUF6876 family protein [Lentisphaerota bacterium]